MVRVKKGDCAPDFALQSNKGENISWSQFLGKKNIAFFFHPREEEPTCIKEAESFRDNY